MAALEDEIFTPEVDYLRSDPFHPNRVKLGKSLKVFRNVRI